MTQGISSPLHNYKMSALTVQHHMVCTCTLAGRDSRCS